MTISLNINAETPDEVVNAIRSLAGSLGVAAAPAVPAAPVAPAVAEDLGNKPVSRRKPAANPQTIEATATTVNETPGDAAVLTIDQAREHMKKFAADGHMDQVSAALEAFGVKKVSDVDPDAKSNPSTKFAAFIAKIEELVAAKPAA